MPSVFFIFLVLQGSVSYDHHLSLLGVLISQLGGAVFLFSVFSLLLEASLLPYPRVLGVGRMEPSRKPGETLGDDDSEAYFPHDVHMHMPLPEVFVTTDCGDRILRVDSPSHTCGRSQPHGTLASRCWQDAWLE